MQTLDLFLGKNYIYQPQLNKLLKFRPESDSNPYSGSALISNLSTFLSHLDLPKSGRINLIFDYTLSTQFSFKLPFFSKKRLNQIVEYELEQILLDGVECYDYNYNVNAVKQDGVTEISGVLAEKDLIEGIIRVAKEKGGEIHKIYSQNNLLDLLNTSQSIPDNCIYIRFNADAIRVFAYAGRILKGFWAFPLGREKYEQHQFSYILEELQKVVKSIQLAHPEISRILVNAEGKKALQVTKENELAFRDDLGNKLFSFRSVNRLALLKPSILGRSECLNVLKDNIFLLRELKKHTRVLKLSAALFFSCLVVYSLSVGYNSYKLNIEHGYLKKKLTQTIGKYLPKGTSKTNAVFILKEKLSQYQSLNEGNEVYEHRSYRLIQILKDVSAIRKDIAGVTLRKMSVNHTSVVLQGELNNGEMYETLSEKLSALFPAEKYRIRMNQKIEGSHISFSAIIRAKEVN